MADWLSMRETGALRASRVSANLRCNRILAEARFLIIPPTFPLAHPLQTCYPFGRPTAGAFPAEREGGSMVAGHLQEKNGYFYAVLSYKDSNNKRKTKWIPTGYPVRGNKKKAEAFLTEQRKAFEIPEEDMTSAAPDELYRCT